MATISENGSSDRSVAVIGMACRFPGANNPEAFWANLRDGVESISFFTQEELEAEGVWATEWKDPRYVRAAGVLEDIETFDAEFFRYSPAEAEWIDPQQRLFLELAWEATERAGYSEERLRGTTGLFAGVAPSTYLINNLLPLLDQSNVIACYKALLANEKDHLCMRVAHKLDFRGPCISIQTACSTSLVAVHFACQSLLNGECDMALAGGVSVRVPQRVGYRYQEGMILSPDGHCRPFDAKARGTVRGSGAGVVVLRRLSEALADQDSILAVILGSAVNNDGAGKLSYAAPSANGQAAVVAEALAVAGVPADKIGYVEAHGTGTALGDVIEVAALNRAFSGSATTRCLLGSVKSNIGHLDAAAGIAGLIKTVLTLQHAQIPPSLHFERSNPAVALDAGPFQVCAELTDWPVDASRRRAGVSSFGIGGTNAHVVLEEAPPCAPSPSSRSYHLLTLSARTPNALRSSALDLASHLTERRDQDLADIAYTLHVGRRAFPFRLALGSRTREGAIRALSPAAILSPQKSSERPVAFLFKGRLPTLVPDWRELIREPALSRAFARCAAPFEEHCGCSIEAVLQDPALVTTKNQNLLAVAIEWSLACLWSAWGVRPAASLGSGVGLISAACVAQLLTLEEAFAFTAVQGQALAVSPNGNNSPEALARMRRECENIPCMAHGIRWGAAEENRLCFVVDTEVSVEDALISDPDFRVSKGLAPNSLVFCPSENRGDSRLSHDETIAALPPQGSSLTALEQMVEVLGELWAHGVAVDWQAFHAEERSHRIVLPTHPFERRRHWISQPHGNGRPVDSATHRPKPDLTDWLVLPAWKEAPYCSTTPDSWIGLWLVFSDGSAWQSNLVQRLKQSGCAVRTVRIGRNFFQDPSGDFAIRPEELGDYRRLVETLRSSNEVPGRVLHLWLCKSPGGAEDAAAVEEDLALGFRSVTFLIQALAPYKSGLLDLTVVTSDAAEVTGGDLLRPGAAAVRGVCDTVPFEWPGATARILDMQRGIPEVQTVEDLLAELSGPQADCHVAYRSHRRWIPDFVRPDPPAPGFSRLREEGVYLITGGLGAIGWTLARYLAQTMRARLIVIGRSRLPPREQWDLRIRELGEAHSVSRAIQRLRLLEAEARKAVIYIPADVADLGAMQMVVATALREFGRIDGAVHAAGIPGGGLLRGRDQAAIDAVLAPKIRGTLALDQALRQCEPDFLLLCSSLASLRGGPGQADYRAANAFLDAFARYRSSKSGRRTVSVNWDSWQGIGMAADAASWPGVSLWLENRKHLVLTPEQGVRAFVQALNLEVTQVAVCTGGAEALRSKPTPARPALDPVNRNLANACEDGSQPRNETERILADLWKERLKVESVGIHDDFFNLGGDSLLAIELLGEVQARFGLTTLPAHSLLTAPTVAACAELLDRLRSADCSLSQATAQSDLLVRLGDGTEDPLFLVHPVGGHVYFYRDLARSLDHDRAVFGIRAAGVDDTHTVVSSVEEMASSYVDAIQTVQNSGPYRLAGASFGGTIAFEMAQQLVAQGKTIELVALIDTPGPGHMPRRLETEKEIASYYRNMMLKDVRGSESFPTTLSEFDDWMGQSELATRYFSNAREVRRLVRLFQAHSDAMRAYVPRSYPGSVTFFRARERDAFNPAHPEHAWIGLAELGTTVIEIPGNHVTMNLHPHVDVLASRLQMCLGSHQGLVGSAVM